MGRSIVRARSPFGVQTTRISTEFWEPLRAHLAREALCREFRDGLRGQLLLASQKLGARDQRGPLVDQCVVDGTRVVVPIDSRAELPPLEPASNSRAVVALIVELSMLPLLVVPRRHSWRAITLMCGWTVYE